MGVDFKTESSSLVVGAAAGVGSYIAVEAVTPKVLATVTKFAADIHQYNDELCACANVMNQLPSFGPTMTPLLNSYIAILKPLTNIAKFAQRYTQEAANVAPLSSLFSALTETYLSFKRQVSGEYKKRFLVVDLLEGSMRGAVVGALVGAGNARNSSGSMSAQMVCGGVVGAAAGITGVATGKTLGIVCQVAGCVLSGIGSIFK